jgi:hypothetical protein
MSRAASYPAPRERAAVDPGWRAHVLSLLDARALIHDGWMAPVRCCLFCMEPQGFVELRGLLFYDSGCTCFRSSTGSLQARPWAQLAEYFEE